MGIKRFADSFSSKKDLIDSLVKEHLQKEKKEKRDKEKKQIVKLIRRTRREKPKSDTSGKERTSVKELSR